MQIESVAYRFTRDEMAALRRVMDIQAIPGMPSEPESAGDAARLNDLLEEASLAIEINGKWAVERIPAFLLQSIHQCQRYAKAAREGRVALLYRTEKVIIVVSTSPDGGWLLTPSPNLASARAAYREALRDIGGDFTLALADGDGARQSAKPGGFAMRKYKCAMMKKTDKSGAARAADLAFRFIEEGILPDEEE